MVSDILISRGQFTAKKKERRKKIYIFLLMGGRFIGGQKTARDRKSCKKQSKYSYPQCESFFPLRKLFHTLQFLVSAFALLQNVGEACHYTKKSSFLSFFFASGETEEIRK